MALLSRVLGVGFSRVKCTDARMAKLGEMKYICYGLQPTVVRRFTSRVDRALEEEQLRDLGLPQTNRGKSEQTADL